MAENTPTNNGTGTAGNNEKPKRTYNKKGTSKKSAKSKVSASKKSAPRKAPPVGNTMDGISLSNGGVNVSSYQDLTITRNKQGRVMVTVII